MNIYHEMRRRQVEEQAKEDRERYRKKNEEMVIEDKEGENKVQVQN